MNKKSGVEIPGQALNIMSAMLFKALNKMRYPVVDKDLYAEGLKEIVDVAIELKTYADMTSDRDV